MECRHRFPIALVLFCGLLVSNAKLWIPFDTPLTFSVELWQFENVVSDIHVWMPSARRLLSVCGSILYL